ncbi:MAG: DUF294 nucleotidyltransferase-like domain-containing protein [Xanthomonadales bacterium]|nr:DUF294 nucleotidyltransferase-like domain-containing protein [Xanthomonadales bacterium]
MNELKDITDFVRTQVPFDALAEDDLLALCQEIEISYQTSGTVMLPYGSDNEELYLIRRGAVALFEDDGRLIEKRGEGGVFGYPSLLTGKPTQLEARVMEDSLIYHVPGERFHNLCQTRPEFARFFSSALIERLQSARDQRVAESYLNEHVADLMTSPVRTVPAGTSILDATREMAAMGKSCMLVVDPEEPDHLLGIFTDRDLRNRVVSKGVSVDEPIDSVMTLQPLWIEPDQPAMEAMLVMTDSGIHHLPVTESEKLVGILTLTDLSTALNKHPVYFAARIRRQANAAGVARLAQRRLELLAELIEMGTSPEHVGRIMTSVTDAATRRLIELAEEKLGPPPMRYAWLAFGSQARREQTGRTDQDNGLLLASEPNEAQEQYFAKLAQFVCDGLNECGFVYCPGEIMAATPKWRMSLQGWKDRFAGWMDEPSPKPLMYASIFFDMRGIAGRRRLVQELKDYVYGRATDNSIFLRFMAMNALEYRPPLGFFRQFTLEKDGEHGEGLNLKQRGVVPILSLARLRALEQGMSDPETQGRLQTESDFDDLSNLQDALELIGDVRLRHQLRQYKAGIEPTNMVDPGELTPLVKRNLKAAFVVVANAQQALEKRYQLG